MKYTHGGNIYKMNREKGIELNELIDFSANINPLGVAESAKKAMMDAFSEITNYPDPDNYALKKCIGGFHNLDADSIFLGNGAIDALYTLVEALDIKSAHILAPTFVEYERAVLRFGGKVTYFNLIEDDFKFNVERFIEELPDETDTVILCNPNNPTGDVIDKGAIIKMLDFFNNKGIRLILDEAFMDFLDEEKTSLISNLYKYKGLFILRSLTKFFAIPGVRVGYFLTANEELISCANKLAVPWRINTFATRASCAVLTDEKYIRETKTLMDDLRCDLFHELGQINGLKVYKPAANYIFFKSDDVCLDEKLIQKGIMIRDCSNYVTLEKGYYRVAVKNKVMNKKLIEALMGIHT